MRKTKIVAIAAMLLTSVCIGSMVGCADTLSVGEESSNVASEIESIEEDSLDANDNEDTVVETSSTTAVTTTTTQKAAVTTKATTNKKATTTTNPKENTGNEEEYRQWLRDNGIEPWF